MEYLSAAPDPRDKQLRAIARMLLPPPQILAELAHAFGDESAPVQDMVNVVDDAEFSEAERLKMLESWLWYHRTELGVPAREA